MSKRAAPAHVTLEVVARSAGVSRATASRVLNGTTKVRYELRERVLAAADLLGYIPNTHAQALAGASSRVVRVICHDVSDPYFAAIASGVMRAASERGLLMMLTITFCDPSREIAYVSTLPARQARAILLINSVFQGRAWERAMSAELDPYLRGGGRVAVPVRRPHRPDEGGLAHVPEGPGLEVEVEVEVDETVVRELAVDVPGGPPPVTHRADSWRVGPLRPAGTPTPHDSGVSTAGRPDGRSCCGRSGTGRPARRAQPATA
ncbi:LacI family DNA-binding transcriptional regulator [Nonomuraea cypriaca]|uniref:LacI family DNA-binding transcriptional regulator n=1 Tax=Nonomuraea cypriaca TaxID=1187855 RepID=UPI002E27F438|nr:LacI family DNA-binding transcriptional regulator [Nonomuraea cypriaca]